ncbi:MAG: Protein-methionine-S-oxide reductase, partial [Polaromonas sp.]|nr:Protein-methionine-S-oxide reductase [Polaromonas sp.]
MMSRQNTLLGLGTLGPVAVAVAGFKGLFASEPAHAAPVYQVALTDAEWQGRLPPNAYRVL